MTVESPGGTRGSATGVSWKARRQAKGCRPDTGEEGGPGAWGRMKPRLRSKGGTLVNPGAFCPQQQRECHHLAAPSCCGKSWIVGVDTCDTLSPILLDGLSLLASDDELSLSICPRIYLIQERDFALTLAAVRIHLGS